VEAAGEAPATVEAPVAVAAGVDAQAVTAQTTGQEA